MLVRVHTRLRQFRGKYLITFNIHVEYSIFTSELSHVASFFYLRDKMSTIFNVKQNILCFIEEPDNELLMIINKFHINSYKTIKYFQRYLHMTQHYKLENVGKTKGIKSYNYSTKTLFIKLIYILIQYCQEPK